MIQFERVNPDNNAESESYTVDLTPVLMLLGGYLVARAGLSLLTDLIDAVAEGYED